MDLAQALAECADLLAMAGSALQRVVKSEAPAEAPAQAYLDEVLQMAARLKEIGQGMSALARESGR